MPLDPDKLREAAEKGLNLSKRFDAFMERRKANEDDPEDEEYDDDDEPEEELVEPAEQALKLTPGSDLASPDIDEPWYGRNQ